MKIEPTTDITNQSHRQHRNESMPVPPPNRYRDTLLIVGGPLALAAVELIHPHPHELFDLDVNTWLAVHYAQILFFPLTALAMTKLLRGDIHFAATVARIAMFVFGVSYVAFDTVAGVVTGILLKAAHASGNPEAWRASITAIWTHPIMGGFPHPFLGLFGGVAWTIGAIAAAVSIKRAGGGWMPTALLVISAFGLPIFKSHASPGGPITFGSLAIAGVLLLHERSRRDAF